MAAFNKFNIFVKDIAEKAHALQSDTLKVMLSNTLPVATNAVKSDITELAAGNGYTAGGNQATLVSSAQSSGVYKLTLNNVIFTASGAGFGPFRYAVLYNDTQTSPVKPLIGWFDYGSALTLNASETFTVVFDSTNGVLTIT